jgi:glycine oxidase
MTDRFDVLVVGGGVIGLSIADRLAAGGRRVAVLDASEPGREASWAGSGALSLIMPDLAPPPLRPLAARSQQLWPEMAADLEARTRVSIEYRCSGLLRLALNEDQAPVVAGTVAWLREHGVGIEAIDVPRLRELAPLATDQLTAVYHQPELSQVRPPRLLQALRASLMRRGVTVRAYQPVESLTVRGSRVSGARGGWGTVEADEVVLAAGAWAGQLAHRSLGLELPVEPVRGQIVLLEAVTGGECPLILAGNGGYLIPRADGRILAGSTFERVGFDKRVTGGGVRSILEGAIRLAPALADARVSTSWAGLRPESPDRLPYLGRVPGLSGLVVAAGHFRDGLLLAPVTAEVVAAVLAGEPPPLDLSAFAPDRMRGPHAA